MKKLIILAFFVLALGFSVNLTTYPLFGDGSAITQLWVPHIEFSSTITQTATQTDTWATINGLTLDDIDESQEYVSLVSTQSILIQPGHYVITYTAKITNTVNQAHSVYFKMTNSSDYIDSGCFDFVNANSANNFKSKTHSFHLDITVPQTYTFMFAVDSTSMLLVPSTGSSLDINTKSFNIWVERIKGI